MNAWEIIEQIRSYILPFLPLLLFLVISWANRSNKQFQKELEQDDE